MSTNRPSAFARAVSRCRFVLALLAALLPAATHAHEVPDYLPRYDLDIKLDLAGHLVTVTERVQWTNPHRLPTDKLIFNVSSNYTVDLDQIGLLAKTLEILRLAPSDALDFGPPPFQLQKATLAGGSALKHQFQADNKTALELQLPHPVNAGDSVTVELQFTVRLPQKQGRWGQWNGITFLAQWLPVVAFYNDQGWQPAPFIPWHQPFFNEAGVYTGTITLPEGQILGSTSFFMEEWKQSDDPTTGIPTYPQRRVRIAPVVARDFSLFCCDRYQEYIGYAGDTRVRVLTLPEHEFYGKEMVRIACEAIPIYEDWFGPYPYPQLTIVEAPFGWNGNECGGIIMIDSRVCGFPSLAKHFVDSLLSHEICHQWWYNVVGTNGYAETWMDEGLAAYFGTKIMDVKHGRNNPLLNYPDALQWLPQIYRDDYRHTMLWGVIRRGELSPVVQPMPKFGHLINLTSMTYDRGSKVVAMLEQRLGEQAFLKFMQGIYKKYYFRILRVADFQRELEAFSKAPWDDFFRHWLYGTDMVDWAVEKVELEPLGKPHRGGPQPAGGFVEALKRLAPAPASRTASSSTSARRAPVTSQRSWASTSTTARIVRCECRSP